MYKIRGDDDEGKTEDAFRSSMINQARRQEKVE